jgi:hypothetical protein
MIDASVSRSLAEEAFHRLLRRGSRLARPRWPHLRRRALAGLAKFSALQRSLLGFDLFEQPARECCDDLGVVVHGHGHGHRDMGSDLDDARPNRERLCINGARIPRQHFFLFDVPILAAVLLYPRGPRSD